MFFECLFEIIDGKWELMPWGSIYLSFFFFFNLQLKCSSGVRERFELCAYMLIPKPLAQGLLQGLLPASSFRNFTLVSFFWHPSCLYEFWITRVWIWPGISLRLCFPLLRALKPLWGLFILSLYPLSNF